jgi:hypothetical protein
MNEILPFLSFVAVVVLILLAFYFIAQQKREQDEVFQRLAWRYSGRAIAGGLITPGGFMFNYAGAAVTVEGKRGGEGESDSTQIQIDWPDHSTRCEIYPERFSSRLGKLFGMTDVEVGSPEFDNLFVVTGDAESRLRELVTPDVQQAILALWRMPPIGDVYFSISGGKMVVKKLQLVRKEKPLGRLVEATLHLYDCARAHRAEGIEFVAQSRSEASVICQVCGEEIVEELVHCRRCQTPHHADCWEYFGGCSTFGCGEKRLSHAPPHTRS